MVCTKKRAHLRASNSWELSIHSGQGAKIVFQNSEFWAWKMSSLEGWSFDFLRLDLYFHTEVECEQLKSFLVLTSKSWPPS